MNDAQGEAVIEIDGEEVEEVEETVPTTVAVERDLIDTLKLSQTALNDAKFNAARARELVKVRQEELQQAVDDIIKEPVDDWPEGTPLGNVAESDDDDEAWKSVELTELDIKPSYLHILMEEDKISTVGDYAKHCQENRLADIKGIGQAAQSNIENAMEKFWAAWDEKKKIIADAQK